ncbi:MAG: DsrE family protein [Thioalkalispiraceae bacterium]|jgi:intracellular sulfur oxidation DsrE/DsrF family protein
MKSLAMTLTLFIAMLAPAQAADPAPWGKGQAEEVEYKPNKVVYDVAVNNVRALENVLDRASYLSQLYNANPFEASIVIVLHGNEINYFAIKNYKEHKELMRRAQSLTVGGIIKIRMCKIAAKGHGYDPEDIHGFVEIVPMADAEIIRLQAEDGYAYMR